MAETSSNNSQHQIAPIHVNRPKQYIDQHISYWWLTVISMLGFVLWYCAEHISDSAALGKLFNILLLVIIGILVAYLRLLQNTIDELRYWISKHSES